VSQNTFVIAARLQANAGALIVATLATAISQGCAPTSHSGIVAPATIYQSNYSSIDTTLRVIVRDDSTWRDLWPKLRDPSAVTDTLPPHVAFSKEMAIVAVGPPIGINDSVRIGPLTVSTKESHVWITAFLVCNPADMTFVPVQVVTVRHSTRQVGFTEREVRGGGCANPGVVERHQ
jgi:hypothetical protein